MPIFKLARAPIRKLACALLLALPIHVQADPTLAPVDKVKSSIVVVVKTPGFLGIGSDTHALLAVRWFAALRLDRKNFAASNIELAVSTDALEVDSSDAFRVAALGQAPSPEKAEKSRAAILGPGGLDAAQFPMIRFSGDSVTEKSEKELLMKGKLTLHGVTRELEGTVHRSSEVNDTLRFRATLRIKPGDFGIALVKAGPLKLRNEAEVRLDLVTEPETVMARR